MPKTIFTGENQVVVGVVRDARLAAGLTQRELAKRIERDQSHLSLIERSQRRLDIVEFIHIAVALDREPTELFTEICSALKRSPRPR